MEIDGRINQSGVAPLPLFTGRFLGRDAFVSMVRDAFACASQEGWREIILSDTSFEDWPLNERVVIDSLHAWAKSGRRLIMLAHGYDEVIRHHARFVSWRRTWGHLLDCRVNAGKGGADFVSAIWSTGWCMRRIDTLNNIGICSADRRDISDLKEILEGVRRFSRPAFPASVLGL